MDNIDKLYKLYDLLTEAKDNISKHQDEYKEILASVKGSDKEKKLASTFIAKFAKFFPDLENTSIDAMFDLCEEDDLLIRKQAVRDLVSICKDMKGAVQKVTYAVAQILQTDDAADVSTVHSAIASLYQIDPMATLNGLLNNLGDENDVMRERTLKVLAMKLKSFDKGAMKPEARDYIIQECKKILEDVTADEFILVMAILGQCRMSESVSGQQQLVDLVAQQCNLSQDFDPSDQEHFDRILICIKHALPYFSTQVKSTAFVSYILDQVLPQRASIQNQKLDIFKVLAELSTNCGPLDPAAPKIQILYDTLVEYMPLPPPITEDTNGSDSTHDVEPSLEFTYVESLMYAFHQLCRQHREFLTEDAERMKDFRARLQFFARGVQGYMKKIRESLQVVSGDQMKDEESRIKVTALRTTSNVNSLIRDLFRNPPVFKAVVTLSFKPTANSQAAKTLTVSNTETEAVPVEAAGNKRHAPITFENSPPKNRQVDRGQRQPYVVPSGKFSSNVASSDSRPRGRGGYRGGRGFRRGGY